MSRPAALLVAVALAAGAFWAATSWPRLNDVETGRTPAYPDLGVRDYAAGEETVSRAARAAIAELPRWQLVGSGRGPGGSEIQAVAAVPIRVFKQDVTIRIRRQSGRTRVSVRSRSRVGKWDFGQNARNIRAFLAELDRQPGVH